MERNWRECEEESEESEERREGEIGISTCGEGEVAEKVFISIHKRI